MSDREIQVRAVELSTANNVALLQQLTKTLATVRGGTESASNQPLYEKTEKRILAAICVVLQFRAETIATMGGMKAPINRAAETNIRGK